MSQAFTIAPVGDSALTVLFENRIAPEINDRVLCAAAAIDDARLHGVIELVPSYRALLVHYDPLQCGYDELRGGINELLLTPDVPARPQSRTVEIPVCYGGEFGPDIAGLAALHGMSEADVAALHTAPEYRVYMLGFLAGFPYLGGLDERLKTPRLTQPRLKIEAGSVGIADMQTGVYPVASPGGWQIIGRTPLSLYDPMAGEPALLRAGDTVRFCSISEAEFYVIKGGSPI